MKMNLRRLFIGSLVAICLMDLNAYAQTAPFESCGNVITYNLTESLRLRVGVSFKAEYISTTIYKHPTPEQDTHDWQVTTRYGFALLDYDQSHVAQAHDNDPYTKFIVLGSWMTEQSATVLGPMTTGTYPMIPFDLRAVGLVEDQVILCYETNAKLYLLELSPNKKQESFSMGAGQLLNDSYAGRRLVDVKLDSANEHGHAVTLILEPFDRKSSSTKTFRRIKTGDKVEWSDR